MNHKKREVPRHKKNGRGLNPLKDIKIIFIRLQGRKKEGEDSEDITYTTKRNTTRYIRFFKK